MSDVRRAGQIIRWERIVAKRTLTIGKVRRVVGLAALVIFFFAIAVTTVTPLFASTANAGARSDFLLTLSLFAGAFLLYLQMLLMYNRIVVTNSELLLTAPINGRTVLMARVAGGFRLSLVYALAGLPLAIAYGMASHVPVVYYPLAVVFLVLESLMVTALALAIVMLLMLILRRRISRDFLAVVSSVLAAAIFVAPRLLAAGHVGVTLSGQFWQAPVFYVLPLLWFARGLIALSGGATVSVLYAALSLSITIVSIALSLWIGQRSLHERLTRMTDEKDVRRRKRRSASVHGPATTAQAVVDQTHGGAQPRRGFSPAVLAIGKKDLLRLKRTPGDLVSYLFPSIYLLYFLFQRPSAGSQPIIALVPLFLLVLTSTMGRIPIASFGIEGEQIWVYMQSPASVSQIIAGKWLYSSLPTLIWWELLAILLGVLGVAPYPLVGILAVTGLWLVPSATVLTLPFAVHSAAFKVRRVGQRNVYVTRTSGFYLLALLPYLLVQSVAAAVASLPFLPIALPFGWLIGGSPVGRVALGLGASLLLSVIASLIGWSMTTEAWRSKVVLLLQSGSLD